MHSGLLWKSQIPREIVTPLSLPILPTTSLSVWSWNPPELHRPDVHVGHCRCFQSCRGLQRLDTSALLVLTSCPSQQCSFLQWPAMRQDIFKQDHLHRWCTYKHGPSERSSFICPTKTAKPLYDFFFFFSRQSKKTADSNCK